MYEEPFAEQVKSMRQQVVLSHRLLGSAPVPYREVLADAFSQIDHTLEELQVADEELRQQSEALTQSAEIAERERQKYRELFEFAPSGYLVTTANGLILEANRAASILLNMEPRFLARKPLINFIPLENRVAFRAELTQLQRSPYIPDWELTIQPRHGQPFTASATVSASRDGRNGISSIRWLLKDVTERKRAEQKIADLNAQLEERVIARTSELEDSIRRERHVTQTLIRRMLQEVPERAFPGMAVRTFYAPASHDLLIGGDFFDIFSLDDGTVVFIVGDVSGKGLLAASHTSEVKYSLRAYLRKSQSAEEAITSLNDYLCSTQSESGDGDDIFVALSGALFCPDGTLKLMAAGCEPPLLIRRDGATEAVDCFGLPLGIFPNTDYTWVERSFEPGDRLVMATDGITEARRQKQLLDTEGLTRLAASSRALPLDEAGRAILDGARSFAGGQLQDDACLLIAERLAE
jgi:PAS domain S-box-containing protein